MTAAPTILLTRKEDIYIYIYIYIYTHKLDNKQTNPLVIPQHTLLLIKSNCDGLMFLVWQLVNIIKKRILKKRNNQMIEMALQKSWMGG